MAIDEKYIALINAGLDGELSPDESAELDDFLEESAEGRALHASLRKLCGVLDAVPELPPPPHLRHVIMEYVSPQAKVTGNASLWQTLLGLPVVRFGGAFALGIILTLTLISSDRISKNAFDDVTGLVGTITSGSIATGGSSISLSSSEIAGTVTTRLAGSIMIIDFDLSSHGPVEIVAGFSDPDIWFNGFAQLESTGTSVSAEAGEVRMKMQGKRRYAVYLHNASGTGATISLSFYAAGTLVHEENLQFGAKN